MVRGGAGEADQVFRVLLWALKASAMALGLVLSILCIMSIVALVSRSLLIQLVPALLVAIGGPLVVAERLARDSRGRRREGLATDVLAVGWLAFALIYIALAYPLTRPLLLHEAELLARAPSNLAKSTAPVVIWLARGRAGQSIDGVEMAADGSDRLGLGVGRRNNRDAGVEVIEFNAGARVDVDARATDGGAQSDGSLDADGPTETDGAPRTLAVEETLSLRQVLGIVEPSLVTVSVCRTDGSYLSASGFVLDDGGTIATAASVVSRAQSVAVRLSDGRWLRQVSLVALDETLGAALLSTSTELDHRAPRLGLGADLDADDVLVIMGNPLGLEPTLVPGTLAGRRGEEEILVLTGRVDAATLGGPVVDIEGAIVGVAMRGPTPRSLRPQGAPPVNLAVPTTALVAMEPLTPPRRLYGRGTRPPLVW